MDFFDGLFLPYLFFFFFLFDYYCNATSAYFAYCRVTTISTTAINRKKQLRILFVLRMRVCLQKKE